MSDLYESLKTEFQDSDYRYGYAESFLNTKLATQIKTLREQRGKTQAEVGALMGIKQPGYRRFEDINHSVWRTDTLWNIARAHGVRVDISFKTFGSLLDDKKRFNRQALELPTFEEDPAFNEEEIENAAASEMQPALSLTALTRSPDDQAQFDKFTSTLQEKENQGVNPYLSSVDEQGLGRLNLIQGGGNKINPGLGGLVNDTVGTSRVLASGANRMVSGISLDEDLPGPKRSWNSRRHAPHGRVRNARR